MNSYESKIKTALIYSEQTGQDCVPKYAFNSKKQPANSGCWLRLSK